MSELTGGYMSASKEAKQRGFKSLAEVVRISKKPRQTLIDWYTSDRWTFDAILDKALTEKEVK